MLQRDIAPIAPPPIMLAAIALQDYTGSMDGPDLTTLARRYLDLWERQVSAGPMANTGAAAATDAARKMSAAMQGLMSKTEGQSDESENSPSSNPSIETNVRADGAPASKSASVNGDGLNDEFARRLAECAERFAALASGAGGGSGGPEGGAGGS